MTTITAKSTVPRPPTSGPLRKIDVAKALKLRLAGRALTEIAARYDCSTQAVSQALAPFKAFITLTAPDSLQAYQAQRPAILSAVEMRILQSLVDGDKLEKASANNLGYCLTQVSNLRRLESGQATQIGAFAMLVMQADAKLGAPAAKVPYSDTQEPIDISCTQSHNVTLDDAPSDNNDLRADVV